jgi:hypothetical protein
MKKYQNRFFLRGVKEDPSQKGKQKQGIKDFGTYNTLYRLPLISLIEILTLMRHLPQLPLPDTTCHFLNHKNQKNVIMPIGKNKQSKSTK